MTLIQTNKIIIFFSLLIFTCALQSCHKDSEDDIISFFKSNKMGYDSLIQYVNRNIIRPRKSEQYNRFTLIACKTNNKMKVDVICDYNLVDIFKKLRIVSASIEKNACDSLHQYDLIILNLNFTIPDKKIYLCYTYCENENIIINENKYADIPLNSNWFLHVDK